jgi:hypothetical protein
VLFWWLVIGKVCELQSPGLLKLKSFIFFGESMYEQLSGDSSGSKMKNSLAFPSTHVSRVIEEHSN